jgi:hypothetical protein
VFPIAGAQNNWLQASQTDYSLAALKVTRKRFPFVVHFCQGRRNENRYLFLVFAAVTLSFCMAASEIKHLVRFTTVFLFVGILTTPGS